MQNKGLVITIAVLLTLASIFYLSFSVATNYYDGKMANMTEQEKEDYKDSVKYLGTYSYQKCLETQIGLGLDLKGGMNVILEISVPDVVETLADHKTDPAFLKSVNEARQGEESGKGKFLDLFFDAFKKNAPNKKLAEVFATQQLQGKVSPTSTDEEVKRILQEEVDAAIDNSYNVVRTRIDQFGVVQPNIQKLEGQEGRIMVEMPGIKDPERIRKLLQGSANLEFWETYNAQEIAPYLNQIDQRLAGNAGNDSTAKADTATALKGKNTLAKKGSGSTLEQANAKNHPLMSKLLFYPHSALVGYASVQDTAAINKMLQSETARQLLPSDLKLLWAAKPVTDNPQLRHHFELYALKVTTTTGRAPLEGDVVTDAKDQFNQLNGRPEVSMTMNSDGARRWAALTKANIGRSIAIVLDGLVYSAPTVNQEIDGGSSSIYGNFTVEDTKDLANTLKSGRMPAPAKIVQAEVVGPTLGQQSIEQGIVSFAIAFVLLMGYMVLMYGFIPGMVANGALLINLFFTLGILTSFQAALTMSGIAGMVLSLGTAVDANVLIYERTKEELRAGKGAKQAMAEGYKNAFSAIFDSNVTSLITGIILLWFGKGPIQGFATTWIIGILCSFFSAVYLTRLLYDRQMNRDKWLKLSFSTGFSRNLLTNKHVPFMEMYKKTFVITGIALAVFIVSFFWRGLAKSIDFTGGRNYVVRFEKPIQPEEVRKVLNEAFPGSTNTALAFGTDGKTIRIGTNYKIESSDPNVDSEAENNLYTALKKHNLISQSSAEKFKDTEMREGGSIISSAKVGPSVASSITWSAIESVGFALIAIFIYILLRFNNWAFSAGSTIALAIDATTVIGFFSLLYGVMPFPMEVDQTFIGAILTVIGYSINDKVVVFDRIRENMALHPSHSFKDLFNDSINQTLTRTINTSFSTLLVLLCILFLGGESIQGFAFAMTLGVVFGTISSIFVASPIAYLLLKNKK